MQLKTNNGKCHVNCENFSAQKGCLSGWEVGKDCPGDGTVEVPVILTDDGPIIFEEKPIKTESAEPKKRGRKTNASSQLH